MKNRLFISFKNTLVPFLRLCSDKRRAKVLLISFCFCQSAELLYKTYAVFVLISFIQNEISSLSVLRKRNLLCYITSAWPDSAVFHKKVKINGVIVAVRSLSEKRYCVDKIVPEMPIITKMSFRQLSARQQGLQQVDGSQTHIRNFESVSTDPEINFPNV